MERLRAELHVTGQFKIAKTYDAAGQKVVCSKWPNIVQIIKTIMSLLGTLDKNVDIKGY